MRDRVSVVGWVGLIGVVLGLACSGSSPSTTGPDPAPGSTTPRPGGTAAATATPTSPISSPPTNSAGLSCPLGGGDLNASCVRSGSNLQVQVNAAIDKLVTERPDIFNTKDEASPGGYRVLKVDEYYAGVVRNLQATGLCAEYDLQYIQVKSSNDYSEAYAILVSSGHVRRGDGAYRQTCRPAIFPVSDTEKIDSIRVGFYGIRCLNGKTPPDNAEKLLPLGCDGYVSATPKDKNNKDVDPRIHGDEIAWKLLMGEGEKVVLIEDDPRQKFNKIVTGHEIGYFGLCATIKGVEGCLGAHVIE
jgi:hypothetical protein